MTTTGPGRSPLAAAGAVLAAAGVALGAYGAHGLTVNESLIRVWETGVAYQMWHALGAFAAVWLAERRHGQVRALATLAGWSMLTGAVMFSGSLYVFVLNGVVTVEGAAPLGGVAMIAGWLLLAGVAFSRPRPDSGSG